MNQVKVELYLNNLWEEVEAAIDTIEIQEIFHNKLKNADNNAKVQFAPNETLYNQLRYLLNNKIDVKARIKKDSTVVFTGYIRKTLGFEKTQKLEPVKIELVSPSYLLKRKIPQRLLYRNQTVQAIVVDILSKAGVTDIQSFAIPNIVPILTTEEDKDAYFTVIETLLFEYGYVFDFDASGRFVVRSLNPSIPSSPFVFNETNLRNIVEQRKIEEEFEKVIIEWASLETVSSGVIFSDTSGARDGYKCLIEIPPGKYLGEKDDGTGKEWFPDLVHEKGNVLYYENPSLDLSADPGISVEKFLNESKILLSIKNTNQSVSQFIRKLDITASSIIIKPEGTNKTVVVRQEGTEKVQTYKSRFIFQKDVADNLANLLVNYYKYSDFVYSFHSKIEKAVGEIVSISEPGIGTNTVRIISKSYNPAEELYDYTAEAIDEYTSTTANTSTTVSGSVPGSYVDSIASKRLTVYLYQDAKIQPEKPSDTVTYNVTTNSFSGLTNGWTETQPNASRSPIWLISYTTIVSATQVMLEIEPDDWSNAVKIFIGTPLYLGVTETVPDESTFSNQRIEGDWCLCISNGTFYKWTGSAWTDAGITTANKMAALQDLLTIADASDATAFCQTLVSVDAFIQELFSKYIQVGGSIRGGGRYDQNGNIINSNAAGFYFDSAGTFKLKGGTIDDGIVYEFRYQRSATQPATPTGDSPSGWYTDPSQATGANPLWMTRGVKNSSGVLQGSWSTPVQVTGEKGASGIWPSDEGLVGYWSFNDVNDYPTDLSSSKTAFFQNNFSSISGWYVNMGSLSVSNGLLVATSTGNDLYISRGDISFSGGSNRFIRIGFSGTQGSTFGQVYYKTAQHDWSASYYKNFTIPTNGGVVQLDMGSLTVGGTDWLNNTIIGIRIDLGSTSGQTFSIEFIYIGSGEYLSKSLKDSSNFNRHGKNFGAMPTQGVSGKCLQFMNLESECINRAEIPVRLDTNAYTFSFWQDACAGKMSISAANASIYKFGENSWKDTISEWYHGVGNKMVGFYHFAVTWDGTEQRIYVNGNLEASITRTGTLPVYDGVFFLGRHVSDTTHNFIGRLDELRIYNRALSSDEIYALYAMKTAPVVPKIDRAPKYLGTTVDNPPTASTFSSDRVSGDWCLSTTAKQFYRWDGTAWVTTSITAGMKSAGFMDLIAIADASDTQLFAQQLVAVDALIQNLMSKYLKVTGSLRTGNRYDANGNVVNINDFGAYLGADGTLKARSVNMELVDIFRLKVTGRHIRELSCWCEATGNGYVQVYTDLYGPDNPSATYNGSGAWFKGLNFIKNFLGLSIGVKYVITGGIHGLDPVAYIIYYAQEVSIYGKDSDSFTTNIVINNSNYDGNNRGVIVF